MRVEHVIVSIVLFVIVLFAILVFIGGVPDVSQLFNLFDLFRGGG